MSKLNINNHPSRMEQPTLSTILDPMIILLRRITLSLFRSLLPPGAKGSLRLMFDLDPPDSPLKQLTIFAPESVVVLAPHMDDETCGCGGAIYKHALVGGNVTLVYLTDGRKGNPDLYRQGLNATEIEHGEEHLIAIRREEASRAACILGVQEILYLDARDSELVPTPGIICSLRKILLERRPAIVYLPSFMDLHADHWATLSIFNAVIADPTIPDDWHYVCRGYEIWNPQLANLVLDISDVVEIKKQALEQFISQIKHNDYLRTLIGLNTYRSIHFQRGKGFAEAFFECTPAIYQYIFDRLTYRK